MVASEQKASAEWRELIIDFLRKKPKKPLLAIIGPTASGKTAFSIQVARWLTSHDELPEIVNTDSRQLYTFLDIGTAKISDREMQGIPHHLFSILEPKEACSIAWYKDRAMQIVDRLHRRGRIPILVGGSMLYVSSIVDDLRPLPSDPELRKKLERQFDRDEGRMLHEKLSRIDPDAAALIPRRNKRYLIRALELFELTGMTKSMRTRSGKSPYDLLILGIDLPREELSRRINERTREMLKSGWIEEVQKLLNRGYRETDPGMQSIGYPEIVAFLRLGGTRSSLAEAISSKVRAYAKRHQTWWRGDPRVHWIRPPQA